MPVARVSGPVRAKNIDASATTDHNVSRVAKSTRKPRRRLAAEPRGADDCPADSGTEPSSGPFAALLRYMYGDVASGQATSLPHR